MIDVGEYKKCQRRRERPKKAQSRCWKDESMDEGLFTIMMDEELSNSKDAN